MPEKRVPTGLNYENPLMVEPHLYGTLQAVRKHLQIPVLIIRPRGGDFFNDAEFEVMKEDVLLCKRLGFDGVVIGMLNIDGSIDEVRTALLVEIAYPMEVTFHRAFDRAANPYDAPETIIGCGCQRILTSGQVPNANKGKDLYHTTYPPGEWTDYYHAGKRGEEPEYSIACQRNWRNRIAFFRPENASVFYAVHCSRDERSPWKYNGWWMKFRKWNRRYFLSPVHLFNVLYWNFTKNC